MKITSFIFMFFLMQNLFAAIDGCGKFQIDGKIERVENNFNLVINYGTASEKKLEVLNEDVPKIVPFLDKSFRAQIQVTKYLNQKVESFKIIEMDRNLEHEMNPIPKETTVKIESAKCD